MLWLKVVDEARVLATLLTFRVIACRFHRRIPNDVSMQRHTYQRFLKCKQQQLSLNRSASLLLVFIVNVVS